MVSAATCETSKKLRQRGTIERRLLALTAPKPLTPKRLLALAPELLRGAGLSSAKQRAVYALAERVASKKLRLDHLDAMSDEELAERLLEVPGIGPWSVHMYQMFALCRPNVLPIGDLGLRAGVKNMFGLEATPTPAEVVEFARGWHPHCTVATWYVWRRHDGGGVSGQ